MQIRLLVSAVAATATLVVAGCGGGDPAPTAPTATPAAVPDTTPFNLQGLTSQPDGAGVQFNTDFRFTAAGSFPAGSEFIWNFGDGSTTVTTSPTVSKTYGQTGAFAATVTARRGSDSGTVTRQVTVKSLLGRWFGRITGFTHFPFARQVPITEFELLVVNQTPDSGTLMLHGRWADDAGCRETRVEFMRQRIEPVPSAAVTFGVNNLSCADGDFYLTGEADASFNRVDGHCNVAGNNPNCRFTMVRE